MKSNVIYLIGFFVLIYVVIINNNFLIKSRYDEAITSIEGIVTDYKVSDGVLTLTLKAKENILVKYYFDEFDLSLGDKIYVEGSMELPQENTVFNLFNYRKYLLSKKIFYIFKADKIIKVKGNSNFLFQIKNNLINYFYNFKSKDYLNTFILGKNQIDESVRNSYQINGVCHLFAISGMHITLFSGILLYLLSKIFKNKRIVYLIISIFLLFYTFLAGFSPSVLRGSLLFIGLFLNKHFNLKLSSFKVLLIILYVFLIYNPYYVYNSGFLFSFIISFSLILFSSIINRFNNYFVKVFLTSFIAFACSFPIVINNYFEVNFLTPIINIIFVPLVSFIMFPLSIIVILIPFLDNLLLFLINIMEGVSIFLSSIKIFVFSFSYMSLACIIIYYLLILFLLFMINRKRYIYIFLLLFWFIVHYNINYFNFYPKLIMLDVGQGDSFLVVLPFNKGCILIDTGGSVYSDYSIALNTTIPYLKSIGIKKINYLILTHGDADHIKEANNLISNFKVDCVVTNSGYDNYFEQNLIMSHTKMNKGAIKINGYELFFINDKDVNNENEDSLIIFIVINSYKLLFMGDAGIETENYLLENYNLSDIDVLKVGHHGSKNSSSEEFVESVNPKISLISVGENNRFGHPNVETLNKLNNSSIYRTDYNGSVMIMFRKNNLRIETCKKKE
ncbi:MAG: DNA internalization-related competence protein ComEC/Rec2 [Bacilli bacterium]|nr:DNA internalization-related competence protein ComEC/Rec2 [Bacilli bacterium]